MDKFEHPAPYANTDYSENESILLFERNLDRRHIKSDIKKRDKYPNFDGYLEIVDNDNIPQGKLEVQVKTLSEGANVYYCSPETIAYSETTTLPLILALSDIRLEKVYWKHADRSKCERSKKEKSYIFRLAETDLVRPSNNYLGQWLSLVQDFQKRIKTFSSVQRLVDQSRISMPPITLSKETIFYFQEFIDSVNDFVFHRYTCLARYIYPGLWKLGVAVRNVDTGISYSLFGIRKGSSDLIVKEIDPKAKIDLFSAGFFFSHHSSTKDKDPVKSAEEFILNQLQTLNESHDLELNNRLLANEYAYGIVRRYFDMFGLTEKYTYNVSEVLEGLLSYLPLWVSLAIEKFGYPRHLPFIDPTLLSSYDSKTIVADIQRMSLDERIAKTRLDLRYQSKNMNLFVLYKCLVFLRDNDEFSLSASLANPDYSLVAGKQGWHISEPYSTETVYQMLAKFYENNGGALEDFLISNGYPKDFVPAKDNFTFVVPEILDKSGWGPSLGVTEIYIEKILVPAELRSRRHLVLPMNNITVDACDFFESGFEYLGEKYKVKGWSSRIETMIFGDFPYIDFVYDSIENRIKALQK